MNSSSANITDGAGQFHAVLKSLQEFDNLEVLPLVKSLLSLNDREEVFVANYYRTTANIRTLLIMSSSSHFQAISMVARSLFEIAVDTHLLRTEPSAIEKSLAFARSEKLRAARKVVTFAAQMTPEQRRPDVTFEAQFIANNETSIQQEKKYPLS